MKSSLLCLFGLLALGACSDVPSREKFPGGQGKTTDGQNAEMSRAMLGGFDPLNNPISGTGPRVGESPEKSEKADVASGPSIRGTVVLGPGIRAPVTALLYIAARHKGQGGPPIAVKRVPNATLPYEFTLSSADAMMAGSPFEGPVEITARLDQDGDPLSREPGDVQGVKPAAVGDRGVKIVLDDVIQ